MSDANNKLTALTDMIKRMHYLEDLKERLSEKTKEVNKEYDALRLGAIPEAMAELEIPNLTVAEIGRVSVTADVYASIPAEFKETAYDWLNDNGYGNCIVETVNSSTLKAVFRKRLREGQEIPEGIFKVTPFSRVSITKI